LHLPSIVDELRSEDYDATTLPYFQRISVSGEEMSGVSAAIFAESLGPYYLVGFSLNERVNRI